MTGSAGTERPSRATEDEGDPVCLPRHTTDLLGHEAAEAEVAAALTSGRLAHAWLISGPRGIGKATLAYRIARRVLVPRDRGQGPDQAAAVAMAPPMLFGADLPGDPATLDPTLRPGGGEPGAGSASPLTVDPDHPVCHRIAAGAHPDLRVLERGWMDEGKSPPPRGERKARRRAVIAVDEVRAVTAFLAMTPAEGGWRVVIVDEAEAMNRHAANALLKTLEEPPDRALILLVSHNPARLLPTIRSRCRQLVLRPLSPPVLETLLARHLPAQTAADRAALAGLAEGSLGRALELEAQDGLVVFRACLSLLSGLGRGGGLDVVRLHALGDQAAREDRVFAALADLLPWWLARLTRFGARATDEEAAPAPAPSTASLVPEEEAVVRRLVAAAPLDRWIEVWEKVGALFERARRIHLDRKQVVLSAFFHVARCAAEG